MSVRSPRAFFVLPPATMPGMALCVALGVGPCIAPAMAQGVPAPAAERFGARYALPASLPPGLALESAARGLPAPTPVPRGAAGSRSPEASLAIVQALSARPLRWGLGYALRLDDADPEPGEPPRGRVARRVDAFVDYAPTPCASLRVAARNLAGRTAARGAGPYLGIALRWRFGAGCTAS